jgi:hypothetical protein
VEFASFGVNERQCDFKFQVRLALVTIALFLAPQNRKCRPNSGYSTKHQVLGRTFIHKVSVEGCDDFADLKEAIRRNPELAIPQNALITVYIDFNAVRYRPDGVEIDVGDSPSSYLEGNSRAFPLVVKTTAVLKSSRQVTTRKMSANVSCRKYLEALAVKLCTYYVFTEKSKLGATFGDVSEAIQVGKNDKEPGWSHVLEANTYEQEDENGDMVQINAGDPKFPTPLPSLFTADEWDKLRVWNESTTTRIHDALLHSTSNGKPFVILPHSDFNKEMVSFLINVGVKATLFFSPDDLEVKNEDLFSESSFVRKSLI